MEIPVTPQQFATMQQRAGISASATSGIVEQYKVQAHWLYEERPPDGGVLTLTILKKPRLMPDSFIFGRFKKWAGLT